MKTELQKIWVKSELGERVYTYLDQHQELALSIRIGDEKAARFWLKNDACFGHLDSYGYTILGACIITFPTTKIESIRLALELGANLDDVGNGYSVLELVEKGKEEDAKMFEEHPVSDEIIKEQKQHRLKTIQLLKEFIR